MLSHAPLYPVACRFKSSAGADRALVGSTWNATAGGVAVPYRSGFYETAGDVKVFVVAFAFSLVGFFCPVSCRAFISGFYPHSGWSRCWVRCMVVSDDDEGWRCYLPNGLWGRANTRSRHNTSLLLHFGKKIVSLFAAEVGSGHASSLVGSLAGLLRKGLPSVSCLPHTMQNHGQFQATATMARFLPRLPPDAASFRPQRRSSESGPKWPRT